MVDMIYRTRSLGVANEGIPDQYADGIAARIWELYIGDKKARTENYRDFLVKQLRARKCLHILDVACGTGVDSIMLLEAGFKMMSVDASDKMLKYALKERWRRRKEPLFDNWVIEEANWLTLPDDIVKPSHGFDALVCLGNSFAHLPDNDGLRSNIRKAIANFHAMLKPGGYLVIDHRNYDYTLDTGKTPSKNIYYTSKYIKRITTSVVYEEHVPKLVTLDYVMDTSCLEDSFDPNTDTEYTKKGRYYNVPDRYSNHLKVHISLQSFSSNFRLSYYPHRLGEFTKLLEDVFGADAEHELYGDFQELAGWSEDEPPAFYIHVIRKRSI